MRHVTVSHHALRGGVNYLAGRRQGQRGDWRLAGGVGRLVKQGDGRKLEVGGHERMVRWDGGLDGRGHSDDGRLDGHSLAVGGRLRHPVRMGQ